MPLPVPADYPLLQLVECNVQYPPYVSACPMPQQVEGYRAAICGNVVNEAVSKAASSAARMFCYNLLSSYNWNNPYFSEVVQLVANTTVLQYTKGSFVDIFNALPSVVQSVLTLYTSSLFVMYPDLKSLVPPTMLNAAFQNLPKLENLKREINDMTHPHFPHGMHNAPIGTVGFHGHGGMHPSMMMHPGHAQPMPQMYPIQHPVMHHNPMMPNGGVAFMPGNSMPFQGPQSHPQSQPIGSGFAQHANGPAVFDVFSGAMNENAVTDRYTDRQRSKQEQHQKQQNNNNNNNHYRTEQPEQTPVQEKATDMKELKVIEGSEMDRAKHQLAYFGGSFNINLARKMEQYKVSASTLTMSAPGEDIDELDLQINTCFDVDSMLSTAKKVFRVFRENKKLFLHRSFAVLLDTTISFPGMKQYWEEIVQSSDLKSMGQRIRILARSMETQLSDVNEDEVSKRIDFLQYVDQKLTKIVNNFIRYNLDIKHLSIDSFAEDIEGLAGYITRNVGNREGQIFYSFETELYSILMRPEANQVLTDADIAEQYKEQPLIPETYSITCIAMNGKELGYKVDDTPQRINIETAPTLHSLASSLINHKKDVDMMTLYDLIVTMDGEVYRLYRNSLIQNEYMIARFK